MGCSLLVGSIEDRSLRMRKGSLHVRSQPAML